MKPRIPPPAWLLLFGVLMWVVASSDLALKIDIPIALIPALLVAFAGILVAAAGLRQFREAATTVNPLKPEEASSLVTSGIYRRTRNPMYVGLLLVLTGWGIWLESLGNILLLALFVVVLTQLQIKPEERALGQLFGDEFDRYVREVRRWL